MEEEEEEEDASCGIGKEKQRQEGGRVGKWEEGGGEEEQQIWRPGSIHEREPSLIAIRCH